MPDPATPGAGATPGSDATSGQPGQPAAGGATPAGGTPPAQPATPAAGAATKPATGDEPLGEVGQKALSEERSARKAAEQERDRVQVELQQIKDASASDSEKALNQAKRDATAERDAYWMSRIRDSEVRGALRGAGLTNEKDLPLALAASDFRDLKVTNDGVVEGVTEAVEAFKKEHASWFAKAGPPDGDGGVRPGQPAAPATFEDAIGVELAKQPQPH